jgi:hypothetical protein
MVAIGAILSGAGALAGALGGKKGGSSQQSAQGYAAAPQAAKDAAEQVFLPGNLDLFDDPFFNMPMQRYEEDPNDLFYNPAYGNFQKYSDSVGGFFAPRGAATQTGGGNGLGESAAALSSLRNEMLGRMAVQMDKSGVRRSMQPSGYASLFDGAGAEDFADLGGLLDDGFNLRDFAALQGRQQTRLRQGGRR